MLTVNIFYLVYIENCLLKSNANGWSGVPKVMNDHIQEQFSHFKLLTEILNFAQTKMVECIYSWLFVHHFHKNIRLLTNLFDISETTSLAEILNDWSGHIAKGQLTLIIIVSFWLNSHTLLLNLEWVLIWQIHALIACLVFFAALSASFRRIIENCVILVFSPNDL